MDTSEKAMTSVYKIKRKNEKIEQQKRSVLYLR